MKKSESLPKTWRKVKLGEVLEITSSKRIFMSEYKTSGVPFYRGKEIIEKHNGTREISIPLYISKEKFYEIKNKFGAPKENDILLSSVGTLGIPYMVKKDEKFYFKDGNLTWFRNYSKDVNPKFIYYWLTSLIGKHSILALSIGSSQQALTIDGLNKVEINLPEDRNEQERIADILSAFDDKIELNNKINETLEQMAQAIFKEWFVNSKKLKVKSEKLSDLVKTQYGYTESASDKQIGPKFLRVTDINKTNWVDWGTVPYCKISNVEFPKYRLRKGDVVIARMADPGKVAIVEEDINAVFASYLIRLQIVSEKITPYFLFYYLRSRLYQDFIFGASTGTTRQSANARVITDMELTVPPKDKILEFESVASMIRSKILANVKENQKLAALRDLLLPKLMSGEIEI